MWGGGRVGTDDVILRMESKIVISIVAELFVLGYAAKFGVPIYHLTIRVALHSWRNIIRLFTCTVPTENMYSDTSANE